jgi:hypothetical protein
MFLHILGKMLIIPTILRLVHHYANKKINDFLELNNGNRAIFLHSYSMMRNRTESEVKFSVVNLRSEFAGSGSTNSFLTFLMSIAVEPVSIDDTLVL